MTTIDALTLAVSILDSFKESSLYDDYQQDSGFTDEEFNEMLSILNNLIVTLPDEES